MQLKIPRVVKGWANGRLISAASDGFRLNEAGPGRKYAMEATDPNWANAFSIFNLAPVSVEPAFKIFTGVHFLPGAFTHIHKDEAPDGLVHVRCNVMLEQPPSGGMPIVDGEVLDVGVGDLWIVLASKEKHGSTPISAPTRVIKSFGGLVPESQVRQIIV